MFKRIFFKLFITVCICVVGINCLSAQQVGIIDVMTKHEGNSTYELTVFTHSEGEVKVSLLNSDGTIYLERLIESSEVMTSVLSSGTYQLVATHGETGQQVLYSLRLED